MQNCAWPDHTDSLRRPGTRLRDALLDRIFSRLAPRWHYGAIYVIRRSGETQE
jgi:hypothetical protein